MQFKLFKNIIITTLPLFAYLIADFIFKDIVYSILIAIIIGILEFIATIIIYKKTDFFILIELFLITILGLASIFFNNRIFFKIKPAVMEFFLLIFILSLSFSKKITSLWLSRYLKSFNTDQIDTGRLQNLFIVIIPILAIHITLIIISALFFSQSTWAFVSGVLLYIMFGIMFTAILIYSIIFKKINLNKYKNSEWFDILDENGRITGKAPREICHNGSKLLHPVVHVHIINSRNELLLQKRAMDKDIQPGKWDTSIGGHIQSGESLINAVIRESKEEQGIDITPEKLIKVSKYIFESAIEKEFVFSFLYRFDGKLNYLQSEIDEIKFFSKSEIKRLIDEELTTPNFIEEFRIITQSGLF